MLVTTVDALEFRALNKPEKDVDENGRENFATVVFEDDGGYQFRCLCRSWRDWREYLNRGSLYLVTFDQRVSRSGRTYAILSDVRDPETGEKFDVQGA